MDNYKLLMDALSREALKLKRRVFISYHHKADQYWADYLRDTCSEQYNIFYDKSLNERIDSTNPDYVNRVISEDNIVGTSITVVLCGAETWKRKYVDWEIYSTLYHKHALLGIGVPGAIGSQGLDLPTILKNHRYYHDRILIPERLCLNISSGYAHWIGSFPYVDDSQNVFTRQLIAISFQSAIEKAISQSRQASLIKNDSLLKMRRNLT